MAENTNECVIEWIPGRDYVGLTAKNGSSWKNRCEELEKEFPDDVREQVYKKCHGHCAYCGYLSVIKMAKLQGFTWAREDHLNPIEIPFPNLLNFYSSKVVTYRDNEKTLCEASEIVEDEEKIKDAVSLVRTFTKNPYKTALTDSFIKSLKLLADTVESQMEEVK